MSANARNHIKTVSCAECRRLKLKCDRVFPCASCRKRGCGELCPNGSLPTRPRAVFQETERLKNKISMLTNRVHDLEDALGNVYVRVSPESEHPLLSEELLALSRESEDRDIEAVKKKLKETTPENGEEEEEVNDIKEGLGTLALHSDGRSKFYGPTAGIESLFHTDFNDHEPRDEPARHHSPVPLSRVFFGPPAWLQDDDASITGKGTDVDGNSPRSTVDTNQGSASSASPGALSSLTSDNNVWTPNWFTRTFPAEMTVQVMARLERHLPNSATAWALCDAYFENAAWLHCAIPRKEFISDIFSRIYHPEHPHGSLRHTLPSPSNPASDTLEHISPEKVAILFMAFAIGTVLDLSVPGHDSVTMMRAEHYHELACTSMGVAGVVERGSVSSVQCLMLMSYYHLLLDRPNSPQRSWALIGLNVHIAQSIGLHRDSGWWNPNAEEVQRRRDVFWELFSFERMQCLTLGLPPSLSVQHIDCEFPEDRDQTITATGEVQNSFLWKKRMWSRGLVSEVIETLLTTPKKPVPYACIVTLDRKLRDDLFLNAQVTFGGAIPGAIDMSFAGTKLSNVMQRIINVLVKETTLILLHRRYFARALNSAPVNIFGSKYGPSVLASYRSACHLVGLHRNLASTGSPLPSRMWFIWNHLLGASIVLAALASRNPWCTIAPGALAELDAAYALFENGAKAGGSRPAKALAIVDRLRVRAHQALDDMRKKGRVPGLTPDPSCLVGTAPDIDHHPSEGLNIISGGRVVKEIPRRHTSQPVVSAPASPEVSSDAPTSAWQQPGEMQSDIAPPSQGSSPGNIFDTLHPDLMEDLRTTNKLNEAKFPGMDWSFNDLASWNNVQAVSAADAAHAPGTLPFAFEGNNVAASMPTIGMGSSNAFGLDAPFNVMGVDAGREDLGLVAGGVTWDPSWQSLMDQLGVADMHSA